MNTPTGRLPHAAVATLVAHQRRVEAGPAAAAAAARLADDGVVVVATGQQPGLLGGPLYALHKAAAAVTRAKRLASETGRDVIPVFWVASEDHDVAEIGQTTLLDREGRATPILLRLPTDRRSVADVALVGSDVERVLQQVADALPETDRGREALAIARPAADDDVGAWFARILARILGDSGLVFVEPRHLAPFAGEVVATLVLRSGAIEAGVRAEGAARTARGEAAPLAREEGVAPLFLREREGGPRRRVTIAGEVVSLQGERAPFDRAGLAALVRKEPSLASGDVVGRVFVQNALLPVVEVLGGPAELAYLAQIGAGSRAIGAPFPEVLARPEALWIDARGAEALEAFGLDPFDVAAGRASPPPAPTGSDPLLAALEALLAQMARVREQASAVPGPDGGPSGVARDLDAARDVLTRTLRRRRDELEASAGRGRARYERLLSTLHPRGASQERVLSPIALLARHGVAAVRAAALGLETGAPPRLLRV